MNKVISLSLRSPQLVFLPGEEVRTDMQILITGTQSGDAIHGPRSVASASMSQEKQLVKLRCGGKLESQMNFQAENKN